MNSLNSDAFAQQIQYIQQRVAQLQQRAEELSLEQQPQKLTAQTFQEFSTALEKLHVASEELHRQNEELSATHQALEASRRHYQELFEFVPDGYLVTDINGVIQEANRAAAIQLNVLPQSLVGNLLASYVVQQEYQAFSTILNRLRQGESVREWEVNLKPSERMPITVAVTVAAVRDWQGNPIGLRWLIHDISESKRTELELRQVNERFQLAVSAVDCIIFDWNIETRTVDRTQGLVDALGYLPEEAEPTLGWWTERIHPDDRQRVRNEVSDALANRSNFAIEYRVGNKDGSYLSVWDNGLIIRNSREKAVRVVGTTLNITLRKQMEMALCENEQRLSAIAANIPGTVHRSVLHPDSTISLPYINVGVRELTGLEPEEVTTEPERLFAIVHPDDRMQFDRVRRMRAETLEPRRHEYRIVTTSGRVKWIQDNAQCFRMENGDVVVDGLTLDITELKQTEAALRESEQRLQAILDYSPTAVFLKDLQGQYLMVNRQCESIMRLTREQIVGKTDYELFDRATAERFLTHDQEVVLSHTPSVNEDAAQLADGLHTYINVKFPLFDTMGVPYAVCGISTDITERKQAEVALQQLNEQLENRVRERTAELEQLNEILIDEVALRAKAEAMLRRREQEFRALVENAPDIITRFDRELRYVYVNPAVELATGLSAKDFIGKTHQELEMPGELASFWCESLQTVFETDSEQQIEFNFLTPNGLKYYQSRHVPEFGADGSTETVLAIARDITTYKQAETEIRLSEERFRQLAENIQNVFWITSPDSSEIIYVSPAYEEIWGRSCEDLYQRRLSCLSTIHPEDRDRMEAALKRQTRGYDEEYRIVRPDGSIRWIRDRAFPVRDARGQVYRIAGIAEDITASKHTEEALRQSEERFRQLAENLKEVFWMASLEQNQIIYVSPAYEEIWGFTCASLYERRMSWIDGIHPEDRDRVLAAVEKQLNGEYDEEYRIVRPDESIRWIHDRAFPVKDTRGQVYRMAGISEDITSRKEVEAETYKTLQKERELSELKSRFVSMTSHEFRSPLTTIQSSAELLERYRHRFSEEKQLTHLHRIQTAVERMTQMLDDILVLGKAEAGKLEFNPAPVELEQLCRNLVEDLQLAAKNQNAIVFTCQYQYIPISLDEKLLRQILTNLLSNAIKYSPNGSSIRFDLKYLDSNAVFQIQDQGIGIPPEDQPRLFSSFHRAKNVGAIQGTGLGLAIVKQCVDLHGGEIIVESEVGKGTTFTVMLPLSH